MVLTRTTADAVVEFGTPLGYDIVVEPEVADGVLIYVARHPGLPRCRAQGSSPEQAIDRLAEVREEYLADMRAAGVDVPPERLYPRRDVMELVPEPVPLVEPTSNWRVVTGPIRLVNER